MPLFGNNRRAGEIAQPEERPKAVGYCHECGSADTSFFFKGDFVLVSPGGQKPFYGRVIDVRYEDGTMVEVETGSNDKTLVSIKDVEALGG